MELPNDHEGFDTTRGKGYQKLLKVGVVNTIKGSA